MKAEIEKDNERPLFQPKFEAFRAILLAGWLVLSWFVLSGCAQAQERIVYHTVYKDVYIPVKCGIQAPERPIKEDNPVLATLDIIQYAHEMEATLRACAGE